jgi:hypothetical protein
VLSFSQSQDCPPNDKMRITVLLLLAAATHLQVLDAFWIPTASFGSLRRPLTGPGSLARQCPAQARLATLRPAGPSMVLAPIGPFTPFRSDYTSSVDSDMQRSLPPPAARVHAHKSMRVGHAAVAAVAGWVQQSRTPAVWQLVLSEG